ncbi:MAG: hypothetical protein WC346_02845 [Methanogenium sp.]|jgi:hypothetical protein
MYSGIELRPEFIDIWQSKLKTQIIKCSPEAATLIDIENNNGELSEDIIVSLVDKIESKGYVDLIAQYYIAQLGAAMAHSIGHGYVTLNFLQYYISVRDCLNNSGYWIDVFNNDLTSNEAKELILLRDILNELNSYL